MSEVRGARGGTLDQLYRLTVTQLRDARLGDVGFGAANLGDVGREARVLIGALIDVAPEDFIGHPESMITTADWQRVIEGTRLRAAGMPIGRIAGVAMFYGRAFLLGGAVLEPRADSEVLVEAVLEVVEGEGRRDEPLRIVDIGTGSGCLLISLLAELPRASGLGIDISADALMFAKQNAERNGVASRASFVVGDALSGVSGEDVEGRFDLLISNPPYIRTDELAGLALEVRAHDPVLALDGGADGLDVYRQIGRDVATVAPHGWMFFEVGAGMAAAVCQEVDRVSGQTSHRHVSPRHVSQRHWRVWRDLNGHERCVAARTLNRF